MARTDPTKLARSLAAGAPPVPIDRRVARWNSQPDAQRTKRLGIRKGVPFNAATAQKRLPFKLPSTHTLYEDGSIAAKPPARKSGR